MSLGRAAEIFPGARRTGLVPSSSRCKPLNRGVMVGRPLKGSFLRALRDRVEVYCFFPWSCRAYRFRLEFPSRGDVIIESSAHPTPLKVAANGHTSQPAAQPHFVPWGSGHVNAAPAADRIRLCQVTPRQVLVKPRRWTASREMGAWRQCVRGGGELSPRTADLRGTCLGFAPFPRRGPWS